jgi:outer membrane protein assembly factor BamA
MVEDLKLGQDYGERVKPVVVRLSGLSLHPVDFLRLDDETCGEKNRSVNLFARVSLRPNDDQVGKGESGGYGFNEYRALFTFREPRVFETGGELVVSAFVDQSIRSSFNLKQQGINVEWRQSFGPGAILSGGYSFNQNTLFEERFNQSDQPLIDRLFPQIGLSAFSGTALRDSRNDPFEPTRGSLISLEAKSAGRRIGSEVGFAKLLMQGFLYRRLPRSTGVVFATGLRLGFARGFSRSIVEIKPSGQATEMVVQNLPASERFFAGGSTTVRGFALDRLGDGSTIDQDGFPQGGNGLFIINNEIRFPIRGPIGAVAFLDLGNVFQGVNDMAVNRIRTPNPAPPGIRFTAISLTPWNTLPRSRKATAPIGPLIGKRISLLMINNPLPP